ncbi:TPA: class I SAM-dependent methyltransferase [Candidatus Poribacteria bacterium]|nr:class I SAM-dependent methyltransferase [Candidatus Poribacteria bacterium]
MSFAPPYTRFAYAYDRMMENVDYDRWARYVEDLFEYYGPIPKRVLDIACGTGQVTVRLARSGYEMFGVDKALEMMLVAREKAKRIGVEIGLAQSDMRYLPFKESFDAVICLYDSINYMLTSEDLRKAFLSAASVLKTGGLYIFDVTTERNIVLHFHLQTFAETRDDFSYIWKNVYSFRDKICKTVLTFFIKEGDIYRRYDELHVQRIFEVDEVKGELERAGFKMLSAFDAFTFRRWGRDSDRINFVARKIR